VADAVQWADRAREAARRTHAPFFLIAWQAAVASAYAESQQYEDAASCIAQARELSSGTCYACYESLLLLEEAYIAHLQGNCPDADTLLAGALARARSDGTASYLRWMVRGMPLLLARALERGIEREYVHCLLRQWGVKPADQALDEWPWPIRIDVLGTFRVYKDSSLLRYGRKAPHKLMELLKLIAAKGGREVSSEYIIQELWPDVDGDAAEVSFTNALHRLRKLLGHENAIVLRLGRVSLDESVCRLDLWAFHSICKGLQSAASAQSALSLAEEILRLYRGHLLVDEWFAWASEPREKARRGFAEAVTVLGSRLESRCEWDVAANLYRRAIDVDHLAEPFYLRLMICQKALDQRPAAADTYRRLGRTLSIVLGLNPSKEATSVFQSLGARD
jgi:DNA-binding SARP family transcriptional activator